MTAAEELPSTRLCMEQDKPFRPLSGRRGRVKGGGGVASRKGEEQKNAQRLN